MFKSRNYISPNLILFNFEKFKLFSFLKLQLLHWQFCFVLFFVFPSLWNKECFGFRLSLRAWFVELISCLLFLEFKIIFLLIKLHKKYAHRKMRSIQMWVFSFLRCIFFCLGKTRKCPEDRSRRHRENGRSGKVHIAYC